MLLFTEPNVMSEEPGAKYKIQIQHTNTNTKAKNTSNDFRFWLESHLQELGSIIMEKKADNASLH